MHERLESVDEEPGVLVNQGTQGCTQEPVKESPSAFDLLPRLSEFLDLHMIFPLISFAEGLKDVYRPSDLLNAKMELLEFTHMVDYQIELWNSSHDASQPAPPEMTERRQAVVKELQALTEDAKTLLSVVQDATLLQELKSTGKFNLQYLEQNHDVTPAALESFFAYGKFQFECGDYEKAQGILGLYRELDSNERSERSFDALWGKLACEILMIVAEWEAGKASNALEDLKELARILTAREQDPMYPPNHLEQLQFRRWMLHWSLFVFFHQSDGRTQIVDFFMGDKSTKENLRHRNVMENHCQWLLRYVTAAVIANKNRKPHMLRDLVLIVEQEKTYYSDPITELLECLYLSFDFERALAILSKCERVLKIDYFLTGLKQDFVDNARTLIFETHCRLNSKINLSMLCSKLDTTPDEAEKWIVDLVRNAKLDAKIDLESNSVVMGASQQLVWQDVADKTKDLALKTFSLANGILNMQQEGTMG